MHKLLLTLGCFLPVAAIAQAPAGVNPANMAMRAGSWSYATTAIGSEASFIDASGAPQLSLRCVRANRSLVLSVRGVPATSLSIWTSALSRSVPATYDAASGRVSASLAANDRLLDEIAFSRGRFSFAVAGLSPVVVPARPEAARAIEDCRN